MDLVQVELDDDALPDTPRRARWSVRAWLRLTAVLAVLAAAAAVVQVRATSAAEARIAAVLGTTEDLTVAREEAWRVAGDVVLGAVDDVLVIRKLLGGATVVSLADGTPVWSRDTGICYLVDLDGGTPQVRTAERTRLVCQRWSGSPSGGLLGAEALDPTTGEVIAEAPLVSSGGGYVTSWREVLVSVGVDQSHRLIARGWSMVTGERTWTWTGEVDAVPQNDPWRAQGVLAVEFDGRRAVLDVETGTELTDLSGVPSREPVPLPGGGSIATLVTPDGSEVVVADADGTPLASLPGGFYLAPAVDDPASRGVLAVYDAAFDLVGLDARTGEPLWSLKDRAYRSLASLDGALVVGYPVRALDPRTGLTRWRSTSMSAPISDGRHVGLVEGDRLDVRDARSGALVAVWPLPVAAEAVSALPGGRWALAADGEIVVLAPA